MAEEPSQPALTQAQRPLNLTPVGVSLNLIYTSTNHSHKLIVQYSSEKLLLIPQVFAQPLYISRTKWKSSKNGSTPT